MKNEKLINYDYYVGKNFKELNSLEKAILRVLQFDWIMRPTTPETKTEYKFVWRFGNNEEGYLLEADMEETETAYKIIHSGKINSRDVLHNLSSTFRKCTDTVKENESMFGDYNG